MAEPLSFGQGIKLNKVVMRLRVDDLHLTPEQVDRLASQLEQHMQRQMVAAIEQTFSGGRHLGYGVWREEPPTPKALPAPKE